MKNQYHQLFKYTKITFVKALFPIQKNDICITKFSEDKREVIPETAIGIWNKYEDVARNYDERFENQFKKINKKVKNPHNQ